MNDNYDITFDFRIEWQKKILAWYSKNKRDLPWRKRSYQNFYKVWISEIMLQQTVVSTVIPFYQKFMKKWPTLKSFLKASQEEILFMWQGLGYYRRAINLFKAKEFLKNNKLRINSKSLMNIPGIGEYSSCSIAAILKDEPCAVIDANIERILSRIFEIKKEKKDFKKKLRHVAQQLTPKKNNKYYFQSLMDLANIICKSRKPKCNLCPVKNFCLSKGKIEYKKKKNNKVKKIGVVFLVKFKNKLLVGISKKNLLGGLYEFPMTDFLEVNIRSKTEELFFDLIKKWKISNKIIISSKKLDFVEHNFTHFHLKLLMVEIILNNKKMIDDFYWLSLDELRKKPISSLMMKVKKRIL